MAEKGFPGCIGSIDCTHWVWKNCPIAWQGYFQNKDHKHSVIMEAVCNHDMYLIHVFVGVPGSNNDLNVLAKSSFKNKY